MHKSLLKIYFFLLTAFVIVGCEVEMPDYVIKEDKMEEVLYDYHLAHAIASSLGGASDYQSKLYCDYVFKKHGITKEQFDTSMVYYARYPAKMKPIYERLSNRLDAEVKELEAKVDKSGEELKLDASDLIGDTINLWQGQNVNLLSSNALLNKIEFAYSIDNLYKPGDSVSLSFGVHFIKPEDNNSTQIAHAALLYEYTDSTFESSGKGITNDGFYVLAVERDFTKTIKEVRGFIYYNDNDTLFRSRMLISNMKVERLREANDSVGVQTEGDNPDKAKMIRPDNSYAAPKRAD